MDPLPDLLLEYMTCLKRVYETPPRPWGPLPECELIKLAMIKEEQCGGPDDSIDLHRNVEKKMAEKSPVEIDKLFDDDTFDKDHKVILVEGAPGMGKTMLAHHYCQKWAAGELSMFDAVILVPLRELDEESDSSLANHLLIASAEDLTEATKKTAEHVTGLLKNMKILFIFDGWDEFPATCKVRVRSRVWRTIKKPQSVSPQATILITSRPDSSLDLHKLANRVQILGFTEANVHEYFRKALQHKFSTNRIESGFSKLRNHLDDYPVIKSSCYVPLNTAILVYVFCDRGQALPRTHYELFHELVLCLINRERESRLNMGDVEGVSSFEDLEVKDQLSHICKLAYKGVMQNKTIFKQKEFSAYNLPTHISTLGLLQRVEHFVYSCRTFSYHFLHLSIQELLAARHISQMEEGEQVKVFINLLGEPRFFAILQFYAAVTKLTSQGVRNIITGRQFLLEDQRTRQTRLLLLLNCLFEAQLQDQSLYHQIISNLNSELDLHCTTLSPVDCMSVGYFLASILPMTTGQLTVNLEMCSITAHSLSLLLGELSRHTDTSAGVLQGTVLLYIGYNWEIGDSGITQIARAHSMNSILRTLRIKWCGITEMGAESLADALATSSSLQELDISENKIRDNGLVHIATALKTSLTTLNIGECGITEVGVKSFVETLTTNSSLQQLYLNSWQLKMGLKRNGTLTEVVLKKHGLSTEGVVSVAETLIANIPLQELTIKCVDIGNSGIAGIATVLKKDSPLKELNIIKCGITEVGVKFLAETLAVNSLTKKLSLSNNNIGDNSIVCIAKALERNSTLEELDICWCGITEVGVESLAQALAVNSSLKMLIVSYNSIRDNGIVHVAKALERNSALEELNICGCHITEVGVESLAETLTVSSSLKKLIVSDNNIGDNGIVNIAKALERNTPLEELDISSCGITEVGMESLAEMLAVNSSLKNLLFSDNGNNGIVHVAKALERNSTLKQMYIGDCGITEVGIELLAEALPMNHSLEELGIMWSSTHPDQTLRKLAECVKGSALKVLQLVPLPTKRLNKEEEREFLQSLETGGKDFIQSQKDGDLRKLALYVTDDKLYGYESQVCEQVSLKASASLVNSARRKKGRPPIAVEII